jgi:CelD/BcsL family acetyltransferase involved in cellulose biosynthesis
LGLDAASIAPANDSLFVSQPWLEALAATYGFRIRAATLGTVGAVSDAVLFCEVDDIRGRRIVSLPFSDYADPLVADAAAWRRLVDPILATGAPARFRCLRNRIPLADPRFAHVNAVVWHGADLTPAPGDMWARLAGPARQNIRRAEHAGVSVRVGCSLDDVATFYALHRRLRRAKYRLFAQPFAFFANLHAAFSGQDGILVLLAEIGGRAIAGILFLVHRDGLYYKFNASTDLAVRPNDLLIWRGMLLGRERGLRRLDFGVSDLDQPGLVRFKRKFATEERPVTELRWPGTRANDAAGRQAGAMLGRLTEILTAPGVPDEVTQAVGDELYRYFC